MQKNLSTARPCARKSIRPNRDAEASLKLLGQELSIATIEPLRLSKPAQNKLKKQVSQHTRLEQSAETADKDLKVVIAKLKSIKDQLLQAGQPVITTELQGCLDRVAEQGNLEARLSEANAETNLMQARIDKELAALGLGRGDLNAFEKLAMPTEETMRQYAGRLDQLRQSLTTLGK
jgi:DNA-binding FrmR family transcriptional regulator